MRYSEVEEMEGKKDLQSQKHMSCAGICVEHGMRMQL